MGYETVSPVTSGAADQAGVAWLKRRSMVLDADEREFGTGMPML
jgi:hypothetical protein